MDTSWKTKCWEKSWTFAKVNTTSQKPIARSRWVVWKPRWQFWENSWPTMKLLKSKSMKLSCPLPKSTPTITLSSLALLILFPAPTKEEFSKHLDLLKDSKLSRENMNKLWNFWEKDKTNLKKWVTNLKLPAPFWIRPTNLTAIWWET